MSPDIVGLIENGNPLVIDFDNEKDKMLLIRMITGHCRVQEFESTVTVYDGTLKIQYSYEHDGT